MHSRPSASIMTSKLDFRIPLQFKHRRFSIYSITGTRPKVYCGMALVTRKPIPRNCSATLFARLFPLSLHGIFSARYTCFMSTLWGFSNILSAFQAISYPISVASLMCSLYPWYLIVLIICLSNSFWHLIVPQKLHEVIPLNCQVYIHPIAQDSMPDDRERASLQPASYSSRASLTACSTKPRRDSGLMS